MYQRYIAKWQSTNCQKIGKTSVYPNQGDRGRQFGTYLMDCPVCGSPTTGNTCSDSPGPPVFWCEQDHLPFIDDKKEKYPCVNGTHLEGKDYKYSWEI